MENQQEPFVGRVLPKLCSPPEPQCMSMLRRTFAWDFFAEALLFVVSAPEGKQHVDYCLLAY